MSLLKKVSLEFRLARNKARQAKAQAAQMDMMRRFGEALRVGMIKPPPAPRLPLTARMVQPREELKLHLGDGDYQAGHDKLVYRGHRVGEIDGPGYEVQTFDREPSRNRYAGYFSPRTWMDPCKS